MGVKVWRSLLQCAGWEERHECMIIVSHSFHILKLI